MSRPAAAKPVSATPVDMTPAAGPAWWQRAWLPALVGVLCYLNTFGNGFTIDDALIIAHNPRVQDWTNVRAIWMTDWWYGSTEETPLQDPMRDRLYRPLSMFTFALNYAVHGLNPVGYHVVNTLLHAAVCALVWRLAQRLTGDALIATIAALIFAVHPVHVEAVAGLVGRAEILAAMFLCLGLLVLLPRGPFLGPPGPGRFALAALSFLAALLAKETAISYLPLAGLALLHHWVSTRATESASGGRGSDGFWRSAWRKRWLGGAALLAAPLLIYFPARFAVLEMRLIRDKLDSLLFNPLAEATLWERIHGPFTILGEYTRLLLAPSKLSCDYGLAIINPRAGPVLMTLVGLATAVILLILCLRYERAVRGRNSNDASLNLGLFAGMFAVSYMLISNTILLIGVSMAERLMYWPSAPFAMLIASAGVLGWRRYCVPGGALYARRGLLTTLGLVLLTALGLRSVVRNTDWIDNRRLFEMDVRTYPQGAHLSQSLGRFLLAEARETPVGPYRQGLLDRAEMLLDRALSIYSRYPDALRNRGIVHAMRAETASDPAEQQRQRDLAITDLQWSVQLAPEQKNAQAILARLLQQSPEKETQLARVLAEIQERPDDPRLRVEAGELLIGLGRNYDALLQYEAAMKIDDHDLAILRGYGQALALNIQYDEARKVFERVVQLAPDDWQSHGNLAKLLQDRDPAKALQHARRAFELKPDDFRVRLNLAEALALNKHYEEALKIFRGLEAGFPAGDPQRDALRDRIEEIERERGS